MNYYNFDAKVELYTDYDAFINKCKELSKANECITEEEDNHIAFVIEKLSIMSI